jgi:hypothetical protein
MELICYHKDSIAAGDPQDLIGEIWACTEEPDRTAKSGSVT